MKNEAMITTITIVLILLIIKVIRSKLTCTGFTLIECYLLSALTRQYGLTKWCISQDTKKMKQDLASETISSFIKQQSTSDIKYDRETKNKAQYKSNKCKRTNYISSFWQLTSSSSSSLFHLTVELKLMYNALRRFSLIRLLFTYSRRSTI